MSQSLTSCRAEPRFVGDPIDVVTGANTDIITDVRLPGPIPFEWKRYYNSARAATLCPLGWGHSHHFDRRLIRDVDGVRYQDPHGTAVPFSDIDIGHWEAVGGLVLTRTGTDFYYLEREGEPSEEFQFTPGGVVARLRWLRRGGHVIVLRYAPHGGLTEIIESLGRTIRIASDKNGLITRLVLADAGGGVSLLAYEYDAHGNLIHALDRANTTLRFAFDAANRMTRRTDRRGYSFHFEYDAEGRCVHSRGDDGLLEVFLDYQRDGRSTVVRRGDGGQWIYAYDEAGRITRITDPYGNATEFILDEHGRTIKEVDPNGNVTELHYDATGRHDYRVAPTGHILPPQSVDPEPPDPLAYTLPEAPLEWEFGRLLAAKGVRPFERADRVLASFPAPVIDAVMGRLAYWGGSPTSSSLLVTEAPLTNDFGYPLSHSTPSFTQRWKYDVSGQLSEHQDRDGSLYRWTYQSWNTPREVIDPLGNATSLAFTTQRLVAKVTDPGGTVTEYGYDLRDKLVEIRENGRLVESYRRDPAGNIIERTGASGQTLLAWEMGPGNVDKVRVLASGERHVFDHDANGRIIKAETPSGTATFAYDENANLLADQRDGKGVVHEFELRRLLATTYFDKFKVVYRTLANGDRVVQDPTGAKHRFEISPTGLIAKHLANGSQELNQFADDGRCWRKALIRKGVPDSLWMRGFAYSAAGDLTTVADTRQGTTKYRYDAGHRLLEETRGDGAVDRFSHDVAGNLISQPGLTHVVVGEGNRLQAANDEVLTYNDRGHLAARRSPSSLIRYQYDDLDMLTRCEINGKAWSSSYDGLCRRVQKTWQGQTTTYYWDDFRLAAEVRHDGTCRLYIYADHVALAPFLFIEYEGVDATPESGRRYYIFTNQIGAPVLVEDEGGQPVWSARLDPYGKAHIDPASVLAMPLRFPGHYYDEETNLHYNRFRYFSPELGRYLQSDPAGQIGGVNVYAYPKAPLVGVDIDGLANGRGRGGVKAKAPPKVGPPCLKPLSKETLEDPAKLEAAMKKKAEEMLAQMEKARKKKPPPPQREIVLPGPPPYEIKTMPGYHNRGPCLSVVVDKETGKVYYGQNRGTKPRDPDDPLAHPLRSRTNDRLKVATPEDIRQDSTPGTHSEVQATDRAVKDGAKVENTAIYNTNTNGDIGQPPPTPPKKTPEAKPMTCCPNCTYITGANNPGPKGGPDNEGGAQPLTGTRDPNEGGRYKPKT